LPTSTKKIAPKIEPAFEVRSSKNTFFNGEKFAVVLRDSQSHRLNDDIITGTR